MQMILMKSVTECPNGSIWKNKKAVSPLIATLMLVFFAIVLGMVIVSWTSATDFSVQEKVSTQAMCTEFLDLSTLPSYPLCYDATVGLFKFAIRNQGFVDVSGIQFTVVGNMSSGEKPIT